MEINYSGNVGSTATRTYIYPGSGGVAQDAGGNSGNVAIKANGWIWAANGFMAASDRRIKNVIGYSNPAVDLETLNNIKVTDYTMRDEVTNGKKQIKKVIAQQVQEVYPAAVKTSTVPQFIPNIYQAAKSYSIEGNTVMVSMTEEMCETKDIKIGGNCKFYLYAKLMVYKRK